MTDEAMQRPSNEAQIVMEPATTYRFRVPLFDLNEPITPISKAFVLCHFGVAHVSIGTYHLAIGGLVNKQTQLTLNDIRTFPRHKIEAFIQCAGHPLDATINLRNVSNVVWTGVRLIDVLEPLGLRGDSRYVWASGCDHGTYRDLTYQRDWSVQTYVKDIPIANVIEGNVYLVYEMNGAPLTAAHGFPLRLFIPGFYGTNSVKWLTSIEVASCRYEGLFTHELYNDYSVASRPGGKSLREPTWTMPPNSAIVFPRDDVAMPYGAINIWGWCWGTNEIRKVEVTFDAGASWWPAEVEKRQQYEWQKFSYNGPANVGGMRRVFVRAIDSKGQAQPLAGARNSCHSVRIDVQI